METKEKLLQKQLKKINEHFCGNENLTRKEYEEMSVDFCTDMISNNYIKNNKRLTHKQSWKTINGEGTYYLECGLYDNHSKTSLQWENVNCEHCLKLKEVSSQ